MDRPFSVERPDPGGDDADWHYDRDGAADQSSGRRCRPAAVANLAGRLKKSVTDSNLVRATPLGFWLISRINPGFRCARSSLHSTLG